MKNFIITFVIIGSTIVGSVSDNKEYLPGVKISTTKEIVYTDLDGNFKINLSDTLKINFISYNDTTIILK